MSNPDEDDIDKALWLHMTALAPTWTTKLPGVAFTPNAALAYQIGTLILGEAMPVAMGTGRYHRQMAIYQIELGYPKSEKRVDLLWAQGKALRRHFYPDNARGQAIDAGEGQVVIEKRPDLSGLDESDPAHNRLFLSITVRIELPPAS
jgi:hypothetical protein